MKIFRIICIYVRVKLSKYSSMFNFIFLTIEIVSVIFQLAIQILNQNYSIIQNYFKKWSFSCLFTSLSIKIYETIYFMFNTKIPIISPSLTINIQFPTKHYKNKLKHGKILLKIRWRKLTNFSDTLTDVRPGRRSSSDLRLILRWRTHPNWYKSTFRIRRSVFERRATLAAKHNHT